MIYSLPRDKFKILADLDYWDRVRSRRNLIDRLRKRLSEPDLSDRLRFAIVHWLLKHPT